LAQEAAPEQEQVVVAAGNPDPKVLPALSFSQMVWKTGSGRKVHPSVICRFPNAPELTFDAWCYESGWLEYVGARAIDKGRVEFRHRVREHPHVVLVSTATPEPGAVEFVVRPEVKHPAGELPKELRSPNVCFQMLRAPLFASKPDNYSTFAKRCFIFTESGRTFLDKTRRLPSPIIPADDPQNHPPWVQMYSAVWRRPPEGSTSWSWPLPPLWIGANSPDRYTTPIIGVVSRDGKHLVAMGNGSAETMLQAYHDCLHNNPEWLPRSAPLAQRTYRMKIYVMENDAGALLKRVTKDFPRRDEP
jgi:hypothetical protein